MKSGNSPRGDGFLRSVFRGAARKCVGMGVCVALQVNAERGKTHSEGDGSVEESICKSGSLD